MRPPGEIRAALRTAFGDLQPCGWRDVLPAVPMVNVRSPAEVLLVRRTVENMVQAEELVPVGKQKRAGSRVWYQTYELPQPEQQTAEQCMRDECLRAIGAVTHAWRQG